MGYRLEIESDTNAWNSHGGPVVVASGIRDNISILTVTHIGLRGWRTFHGDYNL